MARSTPARWSRPSMTPSRTPSSAPQFGADLAQFVREGNTRGLFKDRFVVGSVGWRAGISRSAQGRSAGRLGRHRLSGHADVRRRTRRSLRLIRTATTTPKNGSIVGYLTMKSLAAGITKAGSTDTEKMVEAFRGLQDGRPVRSFRVSRHRSSVDARRLTSAKSPSRMGTASWSTTNTSTARPCCRPTTRSRSCGRHRRLSCVIPGRTERAEPEIHHHGSRWLASECPLRVWWLWIPALAAARPE